MRHFDVGQADATLLQAPGATVLIDAGHWQGDGLIDQLEHAGVDDLDILILTHPHADHIGQADAVLERFDVGELWMSGWEHETATFERVLDAALASDAALREPRAGDSESLGDLVIDVIGPASPLEDIHDNLAVRVEFGEFAAVYTGDAEAAHEAEMIERGHDLSADLLQLGHHGSSTSSTQPFLTEVDPDVAIYMAGADNAYGHPHHEVVSRVADMGIPLHGTDVSGTIVVRTDGEGFDVLGDVQDVAAFVTSDVTSGDPGDASEGGL